MTTDEQVERAQALVRALRQRLREPRARNGCAGEIEFIDSLPMTNLGQARRRVLRLREQERACAAGRS